MLALCLLLEPHVELVREKQSVPFESCWHRFEPGMLTPVHRVAWPATGVLWYTYANRPATVLAEPDRFAHWRLVTC